MWEHALLFLEKVTVAGATDKELVTQVNQVKLSCKPLPIIVFTSSFWAMAMDDSAKGLTQFWKLFCHYLGMIFEPMSRRVFLNSS